jgi:hypothetical protein
MCRKVSKVHTASAAFVGTIPALLRGVGIPAGCVLCMHVVSGLCSHACADALPPAVGQSCGGLSFWTCLSLFCADVLGEGVGGWRVCMVSSV